MAKGKYFLHEHPATAISWKEDCISSIASGPTVHTVVAHQCMYGLTSPVTRKGNEQLPALKPTRFMSNSVYMTAKLSKQCDKSHVHQQRVGGEAERMMRLSIRCISFEPYCQAFRPLETLISNVFNLSMTR